MLHKRLFLDLRDHITWCLCLQFPQTGLNSVNHSPFCHWGLCSAVVFSEFFTLSDKRHRHWHILLLVWTGSQVRFENIFIFPFQSLLPYPHPLSFSNLYQLSSIFFLPVSQSVLSHIVIFFALCLLVRAIYKRSHYSFSFAYLCHVDPKWSIINTRRSESGEWVNMLMSPSILLFQPFTLQRKWLCSLVRQRAW